MASYARRKCSLISIGVLTYCKPVCTCPPLSTVKYPAEALGIHLANALNAYLKDSSKNINEVIEPILIQRKSVKKLTKRKTIMIGSNKQNTYAIFLTLAIFALPYIAQCSSLQLVSEKFGNDVWSDWAL